MAPTIFHMPGHKQAKGIPAELSQDILKLDITEIEGSDNLHFPEGIIKEAEELASEAFGADNTFFLVNGSTCGIQAAIMSVCRPGQSIILGRDAHKSVISAIIMSGARPIFVQPKINEEFGISSHITAESIETMLENNPDASAVMLTRPNYYGICSDIEEIIRVVHRYNKPIIVDEAHGAHFAFSPQLPDSALSYGADICVQSAHKTLPALTQGAYLHVMGDRVDLDMLRFNLSMLQTSSPSYIIMAFLDIAREILQKTGINKYQNLINNISLFISELHALTTLKALSGYALDSRIVHDATRLVINTASIGMTGYEAEKALGRVFNTRVEMADYQNIVLISTIADDVITFSKLSAALKELYKQGRYSMPLRTPESICPDIPRSALTPRETYYSDKKYVKLQKSSGLVCADLLTPYPPGVPVVYPGEIINQNIIDYIRGILDLGGKVNGITKDCTVQVVM